MVDSNCGKVHSSECHCALCKVRPPKRKNEFCKECSKEVEACKKDAEQNDWLEDFEAQKESPATFLAMIQEYQIQCPKKGPGRGHRREPFNTDMLPTRLGGQNSNATPRSSADVSH